MLTYDEVKSIILDEMRTRGYSPNPADAHGAAIRIMELSKDKAEEEVEDTKSSKPPKR